MVMISNDEDWGSGFRWSADLVDTLTYTKSERLYSPLCKFVISLKVYLLRNGFHLL